MRCKPQKLAYQCTWYCVPPQVHFYVTCFFTHTHQQPSTHHVFKHVYLGCTGIPSTAHAHCPALQAMQMEREMCVLARCPCSCWS